MSLAVAGLIALGAISAIGACGPSTLFGDAPSIDRLISNYATHRAQFAALARMAPADPHFSLQMTKRGAYLQSEWAQALTQGRISGTSATSAIGGDSLDSFADGINITLGSTGLVAGGPWATGARRSAGAVVTLNRPTLSFTIPGAIRWATTGTCTTSTTDAGPDVRLLPFAEG